MVVVVVVICPLFLCLSTCIFVCPLPVYMSRYVRLSFQPTVRLCVHR